MPASSFEISRTDSYTEWAQILEGRFTVYQDDGLKGMRRWSSGTGTRYATSCRGWGTTTGPCSLRSPVLWPPRSVTPPERAGHEPRNVRLARSQGIHRSGIGSSLTRHGCQRLSPDLLLSNVRILRFRGAGGTSPSPWFRRRPERPHQRYRSLGPKSARVQGPNTKLSSTARA